MLQSLEQRDNEFLVPSYVCLWRSVDEGELHSGSKLNLCHQQRRIACNYSFLLLSRNIHSTFLFFLTLLSKMGLVTLIIRILLWYCEDSHLDLVKRNAFHSERWALKQGDLPCLLVVTSGESMGTFLFKCNNYVSWNYSLNTQVC